MNLINLKKDIRYSLGDISGEKFPNDRLLLAMSKVVKKLNHDFHLNKARKFYKVPKNKKIFDKPADFYFLVSASYNGVKLDKLYDSDAKVNPNEQAENSLKYIIIDSNKYNEFVIQPILTSPAMKINIYSSLGDTIVSMDKVIDIWYAGYDEAHLYYDTSATEATATIDVDYGILELSYIADLTLDMTAEELTIPDSFYDVIHFKVVADVLSDDNRAENVNKSTLFLQKYMSALQDIQTDGRYKYTYADLLTDYVKGI